MSENTLDRKSCQGMGLLASKEKRWRVISSQLGEQWLIGPGFEFACPGPGWTNRALDGPSGPLGHPLIVASRGDAFDPVESVTIWTLTLPPHLRGLTQRDCAAEYFALERAAPRSVDQSWDGFRVGERLIEGRYYPTMHFELTGRDPHHAYSMPVSGVFLLHFPANFRSHPYFYIFMFQVDRWSTLDREGLDGLVDTVVASFTTPMSNAVA
jgi:hypothetical protein